MTLHMPPLGKVYYPYLAKEGKEKEGSEKENALDGSKEGA